MRLLNYVLISDSFVVLLSVKKIDPAGYLALTLNNQKKAEEAKTKQATKQAARHQQLLVAAGKKQPAIQPIELQPVKPSSSSSSSSDTQKDNEMETETGKERCLFVVMFVNLFVN